CARYFANYAMDFW
nr:immunoglobulin heavy chain junction region [Mus musculus]